MPRRGHRFGAGQPVTRITVAHDGSDTCSSVLAQAAAVATTVRATLRVVTFAVRPGQMIPSEVGLRAEDEIVAVWRKDSIDGMDAEELVEYLSRKVRVRQG